MRIETASISSDQRDLILAFEEGHFGDLKSHRISPGTLSKSIAAFANSDGGELLIGVENAPRRWYGFATPEAANAHLQVFEGLFPLGRDFSYDFLRCEGEHGVVLKVEIRKTRDVKRASDGEVYVRRGAQNLRVRDSEALAAT